MPPLGSSPVFPRLCGEALWETKLNIHTEQRGETDALVWSWRKRSKCKLKAATKQIQQEMRRKGERERQKKAVISGDKQLVLVSKNRGLRWGKKRPALSLFHLEAPL